MAKRETYQNRIELLQGSVDRTRGRNILVAAEIAVSVVLLVGAAQLLRSHRHLQSSIGFEPMPSRCSSSRFWPRWYRLAAPLAWIP